MPRSRDIFGVHHLYTDRCHEDVRTKTETEMVSTCGVTMAGSALHLNQNLRRGQRQIFPGADEERHTRPPPRIDFQTESGIRLDYRVRLNSWFIEITFHLTPHHL